MTKRKKQNNSHLLASGLGIAILLVIITILFVQNPSIKNMKQFADDSENGGEGAAAGASPATASPSGAVMPVIPSGAMITPATTYCLGVPCPTGNVTPAQAGTTATTANPATGGIPTGTNLTAVQQIVTQIQALFNQLLTLLGLPGAITATSPGTGTVPMISPILTPGVGATTAQPSQGVGGDSGEGSSSD